MIYSNGSELLVVIGSELLVVIGSELLVVIGSELICLSGSELLWLEANFIHAWKRILCETHFSGTIKVGEGSELFKLLMERWGGKRIAKVVVVWKNYSCSRKNDAK